MRLIFFVSLLLLVSCSGTKQQDEAHFTCPQLGFIKGYDSKDFADKKIHVEINGIKGECEPLEDTTEIAMNLTLPFKAVSKAEKHDDENLKVQYSVSLISEDEKILLRRLFETELEFDDTGKSENEEDVEITLPVDSMKEGYKYKVVVGMTK